MNRKSWSKMGDKEWVHPVLDVKGSFLWFGLHSLGVSFSHLRRLGFILLLTLVPSQIVFSLGKNIFKQMHQWMKVKIAGLSSSNALMIISLRKTWTIWKSLENGRKFICTGVCMFRKSPLTVAELTILPTHRNWSPTYRWVTIRLFMLMISKS